MPRCLVALVLAFSSSVPSAHGEEQDAATLFARFNDRIVQVRVIDKEADKKSALGTGFLVAQDGLIATNFHVISGLVNKPGKYRLEYLDQEGQTGALELLDVDVINDLAVLRADHLDLDPLGLPDTIPIQGETIYSLGNPYDIGFTVIPGTYNGLDEGSYYKQIHFSGSINAGMSGGPVLDADGGVVGVNVASAGNQVSFLVPADALRSLIGEWQGREAPITDFRERIQEQLVANQKGLIAGVLDQEWPTQPLGEATAVGEMQPFVKCWGDSSDEDELYKYVSSSCRSSRQIFVGRRFSTGVIAYQFFWLEAHELSRPRFLRYYEKTFESFVPDNVAGEDDVGNYACEEFFVSDDEEHADKAVMCVRRYKKYSPLYDALYLRGSIDDSENAFISHFTLSGVERDSVVGFLDRFQRVVGR